MRWVGGSCPPLLRALLPRGNGGGTTRQTSARAGCVTVGSLRLSSAVIRDLEADFRSSWVLIAAAAEAHVGIALLPHFVGRMYSDLRLCPLRHEPPSRELWLITRQQDRKDLTIRTVIDHLALLFANERELFEKSPAGRSPRHATIPE